MRMLLVFILFLCAIRLHAQDSTRWHFILTAQPELTFHEKNPMASPFDRENIYQGATFSYGLGIQLQYDFSSRLFIKGGFNFVLRNIHGTLVSFNSEVMPGFNDSTGPAWGTSKLTLGTLEFPLLVGYHFWKKGLHSLHLLGGASFNFLLNTHYFDWLSKGYYQGTSLLAGAGYEKQISSKACFTATLTYSFINSVKPDRYLLSPGRQGVSLDHKFLKSYFGFKWKI